MCVLVKEGQMQGDRTAVHRDWLVGKELGSRLDGWRGGRDAMD